MKCIYVQSIQTDWSEAETPVSVSVFRNFPVTYITCRVRTRCGMNYCHGQKMLFICRHHMLVVRNLKPKSSIVFVTVSYYQAETAVCGGRSSLGYIPAAH